ncbi:TrmB family transcriptional regulator [Candidatus Woesearchaeota archaeon]|nr:TrmB family transcriptional regulator [Candidatus Woesearchaeota archaeon]
MILNDKLMNKMKAFGLNSYEAKIWVALLSRGVSSAGELSDISNVPRSRAYDVLESLEKKGFIVMKIGKPIKYIAVSPDEVIERVKKTVTEQADMQTRIIDDMKKEDIVDELNMLYNHGVEVIEPSEFTGALRDRNNVYNNLNLMIKNAEKSIIIMTTSKGLVRKADALKKTLEKAGKRGVDIRIAAEINSKSEEAARLLAEIAEIRHVENISARFAIIDGKQVTFNLIDEEKATPAYDVGVWVNTEFFGTALQNMFENVWKTAKPIAQARQI